MDKWQVQQLNRRQYFEGWYYKLVSADEQTVITLIPSFSTYEQRTTYHLQVFISNYRGDGFNHQIETVTFSSDDIQMSAPNEPMHFQLGENQFTKSRVSLELSTLTCSLVGELKIKEPTTLNRTAWMPNIMGPFTYLPWMECFHDIGALDALLEGQLELRRDVIDFNGGRAYLEKNWGSSFPEDYIWLQSNHFTHRPRSLFFSWANTPRGPFQFNRFMCHLWTGKEHLRFATYTGAKCHIETDGAYEVRVTLTQGNQRLIIEARQTGSVHLRTPKLSAMDYKLKKGLMGLLSFKLYEDDKCLIEDQSQIAGIDIVHQFIPIMMQFKDNVPGMYQSYLKA